MINLISDTVTKPTAEMLDAMFRAEVGDDVFQADPTINALQSKAATMFGMEAALFCPSGTMTNQIAINVHTSDLEELICEESSHVYQSEVGGYAYNSRVSVKLLHGQNGKITAKQVEAAINPDYDWKPKSSLVVLENTCNMGGGSIYTLDEIRPISELCRAKDLNIHLDGARLFNALVETGDSMLTYGAVFDSISICLSKGLGSPVGSLLIGNQSFIKQARRLRKAMGGGMRQAGYLAAAGLFALENNIERLKIDNDSAKQIGAVLKDLPYVATLRPVQSNIVIFDLINGITANDFIEKLNQHGILAAPFGAQTVRFVTHLDITNEMMDKVLATLPVIS
ncbi:MAG: aminotransferase class I/II-fold pyridoxal phosphate-dependent enzyme [Saprospiraceae bacterium]|nr:aminotransferase class I/II-fold pyridoxal phosphate-dependent enzyme [Saprospiraceae bacterium]